MSANFVTGSTERQPKKCCSSKQDMAPSRLKNISWPVKWNWWRLQTTSCTS